MSSEPVTGRRVVYIPGNHDRTSATSTAGCSGAWRFVTEAIHETADGRRFLVLHGDEFDSVIRASPWLESLGNRAYGFVLRLNRYVNAVRQPTGLPVLVGRGIPQAQGQERHDATSPTSNGRVAFEARRRGVDGMICGHIHRAEITDIDGVAYCNDGDWVESARRWSRTSTGRLRLLHWTQTGAGAARTR